MPQIPKAELLGRIASVVARARFCSAWCGSELLADLEALESTLREIERDHADTIDSYLDGLYRRHNEAGGRATGESGGLSGRWGPWATRNKGKDPKK